MAKSGRAMGKEKPRANHCAFFLSFLRRGGGRGSQILGFAWDLQSGPYGGTFGLRPTAPVDERNDAPVGQDDVTMVGRDLFLC